MRKLLIGVLAAFAGGVRTAHGQLPAIESSVAAAPAADTSRLPPVPKTAFNRFGARVALATLTYKPASFLAGKLAIRMNGPYCDNCVRDNGYLQYRRAKVIGGIVSAALTVGSVSVRDGCSRKSRTTHALFGAIAGSTLGYLVATQITGYDEFSDVAAYIAQPAGTVLGASWMAGTCVAH